MSSIKINSYLENYVVLIFFFFYFSPAQVINWLGKVVMDQALFWFFPFYQAARLCCASLTVLLCTLL